MSKRSAMPPQTPAITLCCLDRYIFGPSAVSIP
jgi:hypothetical protein